MNAHAKPLGRYAMITSWLSSIINRCGWYENDIDGQDSISVVLFSGMINTSEDEVNTKNNL